MRSLSRISEKNGFRYTLVLRNGRSAIYRQEVTPTLTHYEVFQIRVKPEKELFGKTIPEREVFPSNEDFGTRAWTYPDLGQAIDKLLKMNGHLTKL